MKTIREYEIRELTPYISWVYFFHAWGFQPRFAAVMGVHNCVACSAGWVASFPKEDRPKAAEALKLFREAQQTLQLMDGRYRVRTACRLCHADADGDDLLLDGHRLPLLRQQSRRPGDGGDKPFLCLSDFVRPLSMARDDEPWPGVANTVGVFASTIDADAEASAADDPYRHLLVQTLSDRLAEAATEKLHEYVRKEMWGYAPDEHLSIPQMLLEKFQGIRPAVGYPSLPDQSVNFIIDELLDLGSIGISLTENGAMKPHASVCGLMFAHPAAEYFAVGRIADDQLHDYARRRGISADDVRKFLSANL
jgi:cobalamin-dependent methionine synthase I